MIWLTLIIFLITLPFLIKIGILYFAYIEWMLHVPIPFSVRLFQRRSPPAKKPPIGFTVSPTEGLPEPMTAKRKKA